MFSLIDKPTVVLQWTTNGNNCAFNIFYFQIKGISFFFSWTLKICCPSQFTITSSGLQTKSYSLALLCLNKKWLFSGFFLLLFVFLYQSRNNFQGHPTNLCPIFTYSPHFCPLVYSQVYLQFAEKENKHLMEIFWW